MKKVLFGGLSVLGGAVVALALSAGPANADIVTPPGPPGSPGITQEQNATNDNGTEQHASSEPKTHQTNVNVPIAVLTYGSNNGDVNQSNEAKTEAEAENENSTDQGVEQGQDASSASGSSKCCASGSGGIDQQQNAANDNGTEQEAKSEPETKQANVNVPIAILAADSNNGDVNQRNKAETEADAENKNSTSQGVEQDQHATSDGSGSSCGCDRKEPPKGPPTMAATAVPLPPPGNGHGSGIHQEQNGANDNGTEQYAYADPKTEQVNVNFPISVLSYGSNNGDVHQSNEAKTEAEAENKNWTDQWVGQEQKASSKGGSCGCENKGPHGPPEPRAFLNGEHEAGDGIDQSQNGVNQNETSQEAKSEPYTKQTNVNAPISILAIHANNGDVNQSNQAWTDADAKNKNGTEQGVGQRQWATSGDAKHGDQRGGKHGDCGCNGGGGPIHQEQNGVNQNATEQHAYSAPETKQKNWNSPVSFLAIGTNNGDVNQSNKAWTDADAKNENWTGQWIGQEQKASSNGGNSCGCEHKGPHGPPAPMVVNGEHGDGINQTQNGVNQNETSQEAKSEPYTKQENVNVPVAILAIGSNNGGKHDSCGCDKHSSREDGGVNQSNEAWTDADASNRNGTEQGIDQNQWAKSEGSKCCPRDGKSYDKKGYGPHGESKGRCGCDHRSGGNSGPIHQEQNAVNQNATEQHAYAKPETKQKNWNSPFSFLAIGTNNGDVNQRNKAWTDADATNENWTGQWIGQQQKASSGGKEANKARH